MLELPNFGHMTKFTIWYESLDKVILVASWTEIMMSWHLYKNVYSFADMFPTMFIKKTFKGSNKVKRTSNHAFKYNLYLYFSVYQNFLIFVEKMLMPAELKWWITWFIYFLDFLWVRYNCAKCHHSRICKTYFRERSLFGPQNSWAGPS